LAPFGVLGALKFLAPSGVLGALEVFEVLGVLGTIGVLGGLGAASTATEGETRLIAVIAEQQVRLQEPKRDS